MICRDMVQLIFDQMLVYSLLMVCRTAFRGGVWVFGGSVRDKARAGYEGGEQKRTGNDRRGGGGQKQDTSKKKEIL